MDVYIDDMLIKSLHAHQHLDYLRQAFNVLQKYSMKLNLTKCSSGVAFGKLLAYICWKKLGATEWQIIKKFVLS